MPHLLLYCGSGLAAVQLLRNEQLQAAVDNLISEDFQELGVTDKGAEIRKIVADIIEVRALCAVEAADFVRVEAASPNADYSPAGSVVSESACAVRATFCWL